MAVHPSSHRLKTKKKKAGSTHKAKKGPKPPKKNRRT